MKSGLATWMIVLMVLLGLGLCLAFYLYTPDKNLVTLYPRYLRAKTDFIDVAGIRLHIRDDGPRDAPAVIFLHGFGASLHTWEPWAQALTGQEAPLRVIRFDLPGFALTGPDPSDDYSDERSIAVISALMDKLGLARANIVGNSIGGRIAWRFAAAQPTRVAKLVLISPDGFASPGFEYGKASEVPAMMQLMRYSLPTLMVRMSMAPAYGDPDFMNDALLERYRDLMLAPGARNAMLARMAQLVLVQPDAMLKSIHAPTLVMWGEKDAMIPFSNAADYMRLLPSATLISYPKLGHLPQEEAPADTVVALRKFLLFDGRGTGSATSFK